MAAHQAPLSLGFSRQEYWSGLPFPSPMHACMLSHFSHVRLCVTVWTAAHQAPLSTGFSRLLPSTYYQTFILISLDTDRYVMVLNCGFNLHFLMTNDIKHLSMCLFANHIFGECLFNLLPIFHYVCVYMYVHICTHTYIQMYVLDTSPLWVIWFVNIFS